MNKSPDAFRTISEVAEWLGVQAHVLRFWESKFAQVKPVKRAGGRRYYRPADMLLIGGIKKLLHDDGVTIKGVQKILREQGVSEVADQSQPLDELTMAELNSAAAPAKAMRDVAAQAPTPEATPAVPDDAAAEQRDDTAPIAASEDAAPLEAVQLTEDDVAATAPPEDPAETMPAEDADAAFKDMPMMSDDAVPAAPETDNMAGTAPDIDEPAEPAPQDDMAVSVPTAEDEPEPEMPPLAAADPADAAESIAPIDPTVEEVADQAPPLEFTEPDSVDPTPSAADPAPMAQADGANPAEPETASFDFEPPADEEPSLTADLEPEIDDPALTSEPAMAAAPETEPSPSEPEQSKPESGHAADPETPEDANALPAFLRRPLDAAAEEAPEDTAAAPLLEEDATPGDPAFTDAVPDAPVAPKPRVIDLPALPEETEMPAAPAALTSVTRVRALNPDQAAALRPVLAELSQLRDQMAAQARTVSKD